MWDPLLCGSVSERAAFVVLDPGLHCPLEASVVAFLTPGAWFSPQFPGLPLGVQSFGLKAVFLAPSCVC